MKRKMIGAASAYIAGLFFASFFTGIDLFFLAAAAVLTIVVGISGKYSRYDYVIIASFFVTGAVLMTGRTAYLDSAAREYENARFTFTGTVEDIRRYDGGEAMYTLKGSGDGRRRVKVRIYTDDSGAEYGDRITAVNCKASFPESDYLYDSAGTFRAEGISFTLTSPEEVHTEHTDRRRLKNAAMRYRDRMISCFRTELGDDSGKFLAGMVFGEKQGLDDDIRTSLYRTGIGHVLAVSGLHISIIAIAIMSICKVLRLRPSISLIITDIAAGVLILMANTPVSAVRALIMIDLFYGAELFRRQNDTFNSLAIAVLIIGLSDPFCIYSRGFVLSVAGTFGIGVFGPYMTKNFPVSTVIQRLFRNFVIMLCTSVFIMPFCMMYFGETSLISPLTNIILVPLCSIVLVLGVIYVFSGGIAAVLPAAGVLIRAVLRISGKISGISGVWFRSGSDRVAYIAMAVLCIGLLVHISTNSRKLTGLAAAAGCSIVFLSSAIHGAVMYNTFTAAVLGSGNNAAVVITYRGQTEIIDLTGHYRTPQYVRKFLDENDITSADMIVLTTDIQSMYASYSSVLSDHYPDNWAAAGNTPIYSGDEVLFMGSGGYRSDTGDRQITYDSGILTVEHSGKRIVLAPASEAPEALPEHDILILYGKAPKNEIVSDAIYLDKKADNSMNNFTVTISGDGNVRKRRL